MVKILQKDRNSLEEPQIVMHDDNDLKSCVALHFQPQVLKLMIFNELN